MRFRFGDVTLDRERRGLFRDGEAVHASPHAYRLLELLLDRMPAAVSRQEILDVLWPDVVVSDGSIAVLVNELRNALGDDARSPRWIRTLPAFGYALDGEVREEDRPAPLTRHGIVWAGATIALAEGENVLGRDPAAAVVIGHPAVSRRHAKVVVEGPVAFVEDLGSHNGTFVGTKRGDGRAPLFDGDQIHLGTATLTYRGPASGASKATVTGR
ncbi:MAG: winged helix-turn-helix domain-containing protein [Holophagales bacterium]|nr:winged helix-turn-helix domain-containing protein [Holophagales bacterium]